LHRFIHDTNNISVNSLAATSEVCTVFGRCYAAKIGLRSHSRKHRQWV